MSDLKTIFIAGFVFTFFCFVAYLIHLNAVRYDNKIKSIVRHEYLIKLPDRDIKDNIDDKELYE